MPFGDFVNQIPGPIFLVIHLTAFVIGAYFAWRSYRAGASLLASAFGLYALSEISYLTYHLDVSVFLFAHTLSEVFDLLAFVLVFVAVTRAGLVSDVRRGTLAERPS
jgi:hypothetical protein